MPQPNSFWLTGFFNPNGCLTAMKQEVTRKHRSQKWALNDVVYHTEVTNFERPEQIKAPPEEGMYIHGLSLEGGAWSIKEGNLVESAPKEMFSSLPILFVTANERRAESKALGRQLVYECPVYKYLSRTDRYFIFVAHLTVKQDQSPNHWTMRGTALFCNT